MQHKIIFVSQKDFQEKYNQENDLSNAACISIVDPDEKHKPVISDKWALSLRVEIYDGNTEESSLFTDSNAKNIINFIQSVKELEIELYCSLLCRNQQKCSSCKICIIDP